jgi:hypothetical protein
MVGELEGILSSLWSTSRLTGRWLTSAAARAGETENGSEIEIGGKLTKRYDILRPDHEDDRRARVARVRFRGEVGGGDDADYEAELLEGPACRKERWRVSEQNIPSLTNDPPDLYPPMIIPQEVYFSGLLADTA